MRAVRVIERTQFAPIRKVAEAVLAEDVCADQSHRWIYTIFSLAFQCMAVKKPTIRRKYGKNTVYNLNSLSLSHFKCSTYIYIYLYGKKHLANWLKQKQIVVFLTSLRAAHFWLTQSWPKNPIERKIKKRHHGIRYRLIYLLNGSYADSI